MARIRRLFRWFRREPRCLHPWLQLDEFGDIYCASCGRDFTD